MAPSIRKKVAKKASADTSNDNEEYAPPTGEIPFLKQQRTTKKEKRDLKTSSFKQRLQDSHGISKSSVRRRKRKEKNTLTGGNLENLLATLPEIQEKTGKFIAVKVPQLDPKKSARNNEKVFKSEVDQFDKVWKNQEFRANPLAALRRHVNATIEKKEEFVQRDKKNTNRMDME
ncbi:hypothetical protein TRVA0_043S00826 [Trichomonascus vanleenenianus]|uniref:Slx9p n=1 Tax=Trichomonascus vanleenenianus TaxID=2268995 RepID=UPI003EC970B4